jgi:hypothetical protein
MNFAKSFRKLRRQDDCAALRPVVNPTYSSPQFPREVRRTASSFAAVCLERKEPSDQQEHDRDDRKNACGGRGNLRRQCGELCGEYHAQQADDQRELSHYGHQHRPAARPSVVEIDDGETRHEGGVTRDHDERRTL